MQSRCERRRRFRQLRVRWLRELRGSTLDMFRQGIGEFRWESIRTSSGDWRSLCSRLNSDRINGTTEAVPSPGRAIAGDPSLNNHRLSERGAAASFFTTDAHAELV